MSLPPLNRAAISDGMIAYRSLGSGEPLVFLHGLAGNSRSWIRQFEHFSSTHQVIAWDAPGYGGSDDFKADVDVFTDALNQLLQYCGLSKFVLLGHSMGGILAARYAARFPDHLHGLILSCTHVGNGNPKGSDLPPGYTNRVADLDTMSQMDYGISRARAMLAPETPASIFDLAANISAETRPIGLANAARVISETDTSPGLAGLTIPALIISGEVDPVVSLDKTERLYELLPHASKAVIAGAGHAPYLENPDAYNASVGAFIRSL